MFDEVRTFSEKYTIQRICKKASLKGAVALLGVHTRKFAASCF